MRRLCLPLVFIACLFPGMANNPETAPTPESSDFRAVTWGMTRAEVKATERLTPVFDDDKRLQYEVTVASLSAAMGYYFHEGQLTQGGYAFTESHSNENSHLEDFVRITKILKKKYGKPDVSKKLWKNSLYRDNHEKWGFAISIGHLVKYEEWETSETVIRHVILGDDYKIHHGLTYRSKRLEHLVQKARDKEQLEAF